MFSEQLIVKAREPIKVLGLITQRDQLEQVVQASLVLGQEDKVPSAIKDVSRGFFRLALILDCCALGLCLLGSPCSLLVLHHAIIVFTPPRDGRHKVSLHPEDRLKVLAFGLHLLGVQNLPS